MSAANSSARVALAGWATVALSRRESTRICPVTSHKSDKTTVSVSITKARLEFFRFSFSFLPVFFSPYNPRPRPNTSHAPLLYALDLSHHVLPPPGA